MQPLSILQLPITGLDLSDGFKEMATQHDFRTLQDIVVWPTDVLLKHDNFTYHILQELKLFLQKHGVTDILK